MTMPEAADYSEGSQVTRELQSDADAVSALSEPKKTFLEIMTQLTREEKKD
jgi:hypothetical protein